MGETSRTRSYAGAVNVVVPERCPNHHQPYRRDRWKAVW
jgi:hypothetical protein